jgi:ubiquitin C-terminal hydrolase
VGLLNVSNCCYLNSLLQCYFLMNDFKVALLTAEPLDRLEEILANQSKTKLKRIRNEYELLKKLKNFFTLMALTSKKYVDPSDVLLNLVDSVGEKISYGEEKDLSEINIMIIERLSEGLSFTKKYYIEEEVESNGTVADGPELKRNAYSSIFNPQTGGVKKLFYGTKVEYYDESSGMSQ